MSSTLQSFALLSCLETLASTDGGAFGFAMVHGFGDKTHLEPVHKAACGTLQAIARRLAPFSPEAVQVTVDALAGLRSESYDGVAYGVEQLARHLIDAPVSGLSPRDRYTLATAYYDWRAAAELDVLADQARETMDFDRLDFLAARARRLATANGPFPSHSALISGTPPAATLRHVARDMANEIRYAANARVAKIA